MFINQPLVVKFAQYDTVSLKFLYFTLLHDEIISQFVNFSVQLSYRCKLFFLFIVLNFLDLPIFAKGIFLSNWRDFPMQLNEETMDWCLTCNHLGVSKNIHYFRIYINCHVPLLKHNFLSFGQHIFDKYIESIMLQGIS